MPPRRIEKLSRGSDGQTLGYTIVGGADSAFFGIDATGTLAFIAGPDFDSC